MEGAVERRPDEGVHAGVADHEGLGAAALDVLDARQEHSGLGEERAPRLDAAARSPRRHARREQRHGGARRTPRAAAPRRRRYGTGQPPPRSRTSDAVARAARARRRAPGGPRSPRRRARCAAPASRCGRGAPPARARDGRPRRSKRSTIRSASMPNLFSSLPVVVYSWVWGSTFGLTRTQPRARSPSSAATRAIDSALALGLDVEQPDRAAAGRDPGARSAPRQLAHRTPNRPSRAGADLVVALADAGEDDVRHRRAGQPGALHLAARDHVHAGAERAQQAAEVEVGARLDGVVEPRPERREGRRSAPRRRRGWRSPSRRRSGCPPPRRSPAVARRRPVGSPGATRKTR